MKRVEEMLIENGYNIEEEDYIMFSNPSYETAFVGVSDDNRLIYDYELMVEYLVFQDGMTSEEAMDFIDYNSVRSLGYVENSPIIMYSVEDF